MGRLSNPTCATLFCFEIKTREHRCSEASEHRAGELIFLDHPNGKQVSWYSPLATRSYTVPLRFGPIGVGEVEGWECFCFLAVFSA
jgi:hypothetical protein